jgi:hypothetical protein
MLTIFHNSIDISREQSRYEFLSNAIDFNDGELHIGYYKPIHSLYLNFTNNNAIRNLSLQYYNGTSFDDVTNLKDLTFGLTKSGFVEWGINQVTEKKTTLNSKEMFWYKLNIDVLDEITFKGISVLFSDDYDLIAAYPTIFNHLPEDQTSFVRFHEEARKDIVKDLRRTGIVINGRPTDFKTRKQLDEFDLLDKDEVREASKLFTLSKIFGWLSDNPNDKYENLSNRYAANAAEALTPLITIDQNDDGLKSNSEAAQTTSVFIGRL